MSILVEMVSTKKLYETDNFPVFEYAQSCSEWFYKVSAYNRRAPYLSREAGNTRMRVLLGFIESRSAVLDAVVQSDESLHYLSILCASGANPERFSKIMRTYAPGVIIEQITGDQARQLLTASTLRRDQTIPIPHSSKVSVLKESRTQLLTILLEYRALLAECRSFVEETEPHIGYTQSTGSAPSFTVPFIFFDVNGTVHGIPEFQVQTIESGAGGQHIIHVANPFGPRLITCNDILTVTDIDAVNSRIIRKIRKGYYEMSPAVENGGEQFVLVIPSFL